MLLLVVVQPSLLLLKGLEGGGRGGGIPGISVLCRPPPQFQPTTRKKIPMPSTAFHHPTDIKSEPNRENATTILDFDGGQPSQGVGHEPPTIEMGKFKSALPWKPSIQLQFQGSSQSIHGLPPLPRPLHAPTGNSQLISICN